MKFYERVISDFGGYEKCKDILSQPNIDFIMNAQGLREHMLEYRRQHNIFEAGDVAVSVDGEPYLHKVELGTSKAHCIKIFSHDMAHSYWVHDVNYRHATDEEIKAGKRLEVKSDS